ncbi:ABC transporter permease [Ancylothrix sp. C2]|uniref:ABC transporter permease n=1 Tax=Ancylothrix sp. D3o TaxID=2953691 RepID=UPI0021BAA869|nr:ABC transporter permease [Ancylothrix sp. D3o]MCT7951623.1 ABC transporter permease [Ancylothrix sp. D3o]
MNINRVLTIAKNVFSELIRQRVLYIILFYGIVLLVSFPLLKEISVGTENKIFIDFGLGLMGILGLVVIVFIGTSLINKEIEKRTILVLIAKPISRTEFLLGKHLGLSAVLGLMLVAMSAIYFALLILRQVQFSFGSILLAIVFLFFELSLLAAVALFFGAFTNTLLATLLTSAVYVMGHLSKDLLQLGEISKNSNIKNVTQALYLVLPDLGRLDLKNLAVYGILPPVTDLFLNAFYALIYVVLLLAFANLIFSRRQF